MPRKLYRVLYHILGDSEVKASEWMDRPDAVREFHRLAEGGAFSLRLVHKMSWAEVVS